MAMVLSVDEKAQIQALDRTQPTLPMKPGQAERRTHDYQRHGTRSLYAAFDIATGEVRARVIRRHRSRECLAFLRQLESLTPPDIDLHLILDNSSSHKTDEVNRWLERHPRVHRVHRVHNQRLAKPFRWTKSAEAIVGKHEKLSTKFPNGMNQTGH